ncbi:MAG: hypothetical protein P8184_02580 [Calditrichia bacterium]
MKSWLVLFALFSLAVSGISQQAADSSKALDEVVVKETYKAELQEEKLPIVMNTDFSDLIQIPEKISWAAIQPAADGSQNSGNWQSFPFRISDSHAANIHPQPARVFQAHFKDLNTWQLDIFRSDGALFRTISGEKNPPESIPWDGKGNDGSLLVPGHVYSYSFTAIDKAGNKRTFPGQTFSLPAVFFADTSGIRIRIANTELFSGDGTGLLPGASSYLKEIAALYNAYSEEDQIGISSSHASSEELLSRLGASLFRSEESFAPLPQEDGNRDCLTVFIK